jgi:hypothetical protein
MSIPVSRRMALVVYVLALVAPLFNFTPTRVALADDPLTIVTDLVEEWSIGGGAAYWASNCYADEFNPNAVLKRKSATGALQSTLETINDYARCVTYRSQVATSEGLFYFDESESRLERMPAGGSTTPVVIKALTTGQFPIGRPLVVAGNHLYWAHAFGKIYRTLKDGSGPVETVANAATLTYDVVVAGNEVFWADDSGIWLTNVSCGTLPCGTTQLAEFAANQSGYGLMYQYLGGPQGNYRIYWVQVTNNGGNNDYQIRYRACNQLTVCVLSPIPAAPTFYTSPTNWYIGTPVLANNNLYWTERNYAPSPSLGDLKRRAYNAATPGADTIATNVSALDDQLYVLNDFLFFSRYGQSIERLPLNASAIVRDFNVAGIEVTQAIQNLANDVPLVANKRTYVRAYGTQLSGPRTTNVEARLVGTRGGTPLPGSPLQPINGIRTLNTGVGFDRARLDDGWYFLLPASWISAGSISLRVEIDPRSFHSDPNRANNSLTQAVTFITQPPVCIMAAPVRTHTALPSTSDPNFSAMIDQFKRRYPTPDVWVFPSGSVEEAELCWWGPFPYPCGGPFELQEGWALGNGVLPIADRDEVIVNLWVRAQLSANPSACNNAGAPVHFMGMVHPNANNGGALGYASTISNQSWVQLPPRTPNLNNAAWNAMNEGSVMAQEIAHNYGRRHINCGGPDNIDTAYPYPPCQIANVGANSYYGFDPVSLRPIAPNAASDFMTYSDPQWVSDYTWRGLISNFARRAAVTTNAILPAAEGDSVYVSGMVDTANARGSLNAVLILPTNSVPAETRQAIQRQGAARPQHGDEPHGEYKLRLLNASGGTIIERTLTLSPLDDHREDSDAHLFSDLFPQPAGQVATIQLLADGVVVDTRSPGAAAPAISLQQPAAGATISDTLAIQWNATDADEDDRLLFTVQYSSDSGTTWQTLVTNLPGGPEPAMTFNVSDLSGLAGSAANAARIRVLASDGYNTTIATSAGFTLSNRLPRPVIAGPGSEQSFAADEAVLLQGSATDAEDGGLAPTALAWQVDGVGQGTGNDLVVQGLAPGEHTATLVATDSNSQSATANVDFAIAPLSVPASTAPTLDGLCDDGSYEEASSVPLKPYSDGTQARVQIVRSNDALYACFMGLQNGAAAPGAFVGLRIDSNHSRDALAQSSDAGFFVGENGAVFTLAGNGAGGFAEAGPGGLQAQIFASAQGWSAELRIESAAIGGLDKTIGLNAGHYWNGFQGDDYMWPYASVWNQPASWATTSLGNQPQLSAIEPYTATVGSAPFTLTVTGSDFVTGSSVLWNGTALETTFVDASTLTASVTSAQLSAATAVSVSVRSPAPGNFTSNNVSFVVEAAPPAISSLSPASVRAGSPAVTLIINGSGFTATSEVLWNGNPLTTEFVSSNQLRAQLPANLLVNGQTAGITIRNPQPAEQVSPVVVFTVQPENSNRQYLPMIWR